mmetsp:Transcript_493/g.1028  ORF Transcript_493/g.1028 Transcript_493/m.1028 type:complete len:86 (-) Transcript_493:31-288(-)
MKGKTSESDLIKMIVKIFHDCHLVATSGSLLHVEADQRWLSQAVLRLEPSSTGAQQGTQLTYSHIRRRSVSMVRLFGQGGLIWAT